VQRLPHQADRFQKTIRNHVSNILTKLQVADRAQAIVQARDAGLGHKSRI
jgi:DNA-binding NarL/FixJ family response regulator